MDGGEKKRGGVEVVFYKKKGNWGFFWVKGKDVELVIKVFYL